MAVSASHHTSGAQLLAGGVMGDAPEDLSGIAATVNRAVPSRPFTAPGVLANMIAAAVAQELDLHGPAYTVDAACASALIAVSNAVAQLRAGSIDAAVVAHDNDIVLVPEGYHPVSAAYGFDCYYLNFLAGSAQSLAASDDPDYAWTKETWDRQDPRIPMVTVDGPATAAP